MYSLNAVLDDFEEKHLSEKWNVGGMWVGGWGGDDFPTHPVVCMYIYHSIIFKLYFLYIHHVCLCFKLLLMVYFHCYHLTLDSDVLGFRQCNVLEHDIVAIFYSKESELLISGNECKYSYFDYLEL